VEEFRHTPQIPIAASELRRFEEAKERRRQSPFQLVYTKEKLATVAMFLLAMGGLLVLFKLGMDAEERTVVDYRRKKMRRDHKEAGFN